MKGIEEKQIEAPYELPEGWKWCRLGDVAEIIMGQSPAGTSMTENQNDIAFIGGASDMGEELPNISRYTSEPTKLSKRGDVIVCIRATLGRPIFSDGIYCLGRGVAGIRSETLMKEYIKYGFLNFEQYLYDKATGSTFLQVSSKYLNEMPFPLPPTLAEQQRIVNRIESMFAKLDEAKEKAQNVVDGFETRKAAILHKAFTGELTAKWRKENGVSDDSWVVKTIGEAMHLQAGKNISANKISKENNNTNQYPCFGGNGIRGYVDTFNNEGSFPVIGRQGALCGNLNFATGKFYATEHAVVVTCPSAIDSTWAYYTLKSMNLNQYATATAQPGLAVSNIVKLNIFVPSLHEQQEIVRILDSVLEKESRAKDAAQTVLDQIALLKKSILARAFRGEL